MKDDPAPDRQQSSTSPQVPSGHQPPSPTEAAETKPTPALPDNEQGSSLPWLVILLVTATIIVFGWLFWKRE